MHYRGYDPALGRMLQVDPYASSFNSLTPFNYAGNSPLMINDPTGGYMDNVLDRATVGLGDDYLGGSNVHSRPSLEYYKHWTASIRSDEMNFALLSRSTFEEFFGVDLSTEEGKWKTAKAIARKIVNEKGEVWNPWENDFVPAEEILSYDGDPANQNSMLRTLAEFAAHRRKTAECRQRTIDVSEDWPALVRVLEREDPSFAS